MNRLKISHKTGFHYGGEVTASYNEARMLPANTPHQSVLYAHLDVQPNIVVSNYTDYGHTLVSAFEVLQPHTELSLTAESLVEVQDRQIGRQLLDWEDIPKACQYQTALVEQRDQTDLTRPSAEIIDLAKTLAGDLRPGAAAEAVCLGIRDQMEYVQGATTVNTSGVEAWEARKGVCQDIAHVCLGALRSLGIPTRYVSGYLHPDNSKAVVGETVKGESHAWIEWYTGEWNGFDPTNSVPIAGRHVVVGRGRDYDDVPPLKGVYAGPFGSQLFVQVDITLEA